jgi:hypothetical protein
MIRWKLLMELKKRVERWGEEGGTAWLSFSFVRFFFLFLTICGGRRRMGNFPI